VKSADVIAQDRREARAMTRKWDIVGSNGSLSGRERRHGRVIRNVLGVDEQ
jgi:hypothetical protein